ncbi:MAG: THUMP domain-containing class I SAM-dependent RNA methyltransferase [Persicimonas sp.]
MTQRYFAITTPGFEKQVADEIDAVGGRKIKKLTGGVEFDATHRVFYRANYEVRTANRIYLRVDEFRARDFPELYRKTRRYGWERLIRDDNKVYIKGVARKSHLVHTDRIEETVRHGLREHYTEEMEVPAPEIVEHQTDDAQYLLARIDDDRCQLSLDASGDHLYKRGWREHSVEAPIRESLAAALLIRAGWNPRKPLLDPVCGSGTFLIEAAWMAARRAPGRMRDFAFHRWANFRQPLWDSVVENAAKRERSLEHVQFYGRDANPEVVDAARHNADLAEVRLACDIDRGDVAELVPPVDEPGMIIANPPYGARLAEGDGEQAVWQTLIERFAEYFDGWRMALVLPSDITPTHERLKFKEEARFKNGGIPVRVWLARHR